MTRLPAPHVLATARRRAALGCAGLLLVAGAATAGARRDFEWPDWEALKRRWPGAPAVLLLDETRSEVEYFGGGESGRKVEVHQAIAILEPERAGDWLHWQIPDNEVRRLATVEARVWTTPEAARRLGRDEFHDRPLADGAHPTVRTTGFQIRDAAPGTVVEIRWTHLAPALYSLDEHLFAHPIPTELSRARLLVPRMLMTRGMGAWVHGYALTAPPAARSLPSPKGEMTEFTWELRGLDAVPVERAMPAMNEVVPTLWMAPLPPQSLVLGWEQAGRRYYDDLLAPRLQPSPETRALASRLTAGRAGPVDKVRALYRHVQSGVRPAAAALGLDLGGFRPRPLPRLLESGPAGSLEASCLLLALLGEAGIAGYPALVRTRERGAADTSLVNLGQFDRMLVFVPLGERGWWLDPGARRCPPDHLPAAVQGVPALVLGPGLVRFLETPVSPPEASAIERRVDATLDARGTLRGTLEIRVTGEHRTKLGSRLGDPGPDGSHEASSLLAGSMAAGASVDRFRLVDPVETGAPLLVAIEFTWPECARVEGDSLRVPGDFLSAPEWGELVRAEQRVHPLVLEGLEQRRDRIRIRGPEGYRAQVPPAADHAAGTVSFFRVAAADANEAQLDRAITLVQLVVAPAGLPAAREELSRALAAYAEPLRFLRGP